MALFAALLAGCTDREVPGESDGGTGSSTTGASSTTDPTTSTDPTTTSTPGTTTSTDTGSSSDTGPNTSTDPTTEDYPECVYEDHLIVLTPEEYEAWLHGDGPVGTTGDTTTGDGTTGDGTTGDTSTTGEGTTGDTSTTSTTGEGTTGTDTGTTTGDEAWTMQLCVEICMSVTGASEWDITACNKLGPNAEGNIEIECEEIIQNCDGRMHACIASRGVTAGADPVAAYFARAAHDEAASVYAFAALESELEDLGAPDDLLARIRAAAADEVRHAQAIARLAADRGGRCRAPERRTFPARSAREIAVENAVEGCVRETWAALLAAHQAEHAEDPQVRSVMRVIAADEARHAELAWAIDRWLQGTLDLAGQAEVAAARAAAAASVVAGVSASEPALACITAAGVPDRASATHLCRGLAAALWAA